jgi:hypothetical protein
MNVTYPLRQKLDVVLSVITVKYLLPNPVAERSNERVCGRSLVGIEESNPARGMDVCLF